MGESSLLPGDPGSRDDPDRVSDRAFGRPWRKERAITSRDTASIDHFGRPEGLCVLPMDS